MKLLRDENPLPDDPLQPSMEYMETIIILNTLNDYLDNIEQGIRLNEEQLSDLSEIYFTLYEVYVMAPQPGKLLPEDSLRKDVLDALTDAGQVFLFSSHPQELSDILWDRTHYKVNEQSLPVPYVGKRP